MANERQLSDVLGEFARTMVTEFPIQKILDHLVQRIVDIMPITAAGVTLISPGAYPQYIAASNFAALRYEEVQSEVGDGPCLAAYESGQAVSIPDLRLEARFPKFVPRAVQAGLAAVFAFPLHHGERQLGALDLYRDTPGSLTEDSMSAAQTLADVATAYLVNAQGRADLETASDLSRAAAALHDGLTGLPNRTLMLERLEIAFLRSCRSNSTSAVFFVDLDRFKNVNDTFGHHIGDKLLVAVATRLREVLRPGDTLARFSGDEFVILCEDLSSPAEAEHISQRLYASLARGFDLAGIKVQITASVGITFTGRSGSTPEDILCTADSAMYRAKRAGGGRHVILDLREGILSDQEAGLERDLPGLLDRHELHLEYQPIVTASAGLISGVEALLRWPHPLRGLVPPNVLIPLAERYGLITAIGQWVLEEALHEQDRWLSQYRVDDLVMSVNVSGQQLTSPGFTDTVDAVLRASQIQPDRLILEVTESVFVSDAERGLVVLNDLKDMGVRLALDDFGTGYSSLSYLAAFPADIVKIDQKFVAKLGRSTTSRAIISAVIQLAHGLGMCVIAEGVETAAQHRELVLLGCDFCQGFYFARPMSGTAFDPFVQQSGDRVCWSLPLISPKLAVGTALAGDLQTAETAWTSCTSWPT